MQVDVKMPQLGESVTEGTLGRWLKQPGDPVQQYEPIAEVVTDKVTAEIPSDWDGVMGEILVAEGETVRVGTVICRITTEGAAPAGSEDAASEVKPSVAATAATAQGTGQRKPGARYSPAVMRLAQEHNVPLEQIPGTGEGGRVTRKDVLAYIATRQPSAEAQELRATPGAGQRVSLPASSSQPPVPPSPLSAAPTVGEEVEVITPSPVRRTIARRMVEARHTAPHAWTMVEADVTGLVALRERWKTEFRKKEGVDLTYLPFFIKAVVEGLKQYPMLNASWQDDQILVHKRIHIGIAVATDDALVVPVIRDADRLSIAGLAHAIHDLATRARAGRLRVEDVQGGTFTVNNTGAFGSVLSQPILNLPQAAIITLEAIVKRPVVVGDAIAIRNMVNICLSLDHRLLDGWIAGQFLKTVKQRMEAFDEQTVIW